jgi:hypothetical protein
VITEGLLPYLTDDQVRAISADLAESGVHWWITDLMSPTDVRVSQRVTRKQLAHTPIQFGPEEGVAFFALDGWTAVDTASVLKAASRFKRLPWLLRPLGWLPEGKFGSTVVRLARGTAIPRSGKPETTLRRGPPWPWSHFGGRGGLDGTG